jgi:hypothetical protein
VKTASAAFAGLNLPCHDIDILQRHSSYGEPPT